MRRKRLQSVTTWLVILAFLPLSVGWGGKAVLCFGEDGHIAVEMQPKQCCGSSESTPSGSHEDTHDPSAEDECGHCTDVPFPDDNLIRRDTPRPHGVQVGIAPLVYAPPVATSAPGANPSAGHRSAPFRVDPVPLVSLRTVILLI
jgi:hypothetical protein